MPPEPSVEDILDALARRVDERVPHDLGENDSVFAHLRLMLDEAGQHAHMGEQIPSETRARLIKSTLVGAMRPVTSYQRVFNERILEAIETLAGMVRLTAAQQDTVDPRLRRMNATVATLDVAIDQIADQLREVEERTATVQTQMRGAEWTDPLGRRIEAQALLGRIQVLEARLNQLRRRVDTAGSAGADGKTDAPTDASVRNGSPAGDDVGVDRAGDAATGGGDTGLDPSDAQLYADLEDVFRGPRSTVRALLEPYLDDVRAVDSTRPVIDVGCGRGEWLEILAEHDIEAYGIDMNPLSVAGCVERGLDARLGDAVAHLAGLPAESVTAVTGYHIAEHLALDDLLALIESSLLALVPGGALILETPNCTNLMVGAASFYLDPSHVRPLHPQLLEFLCRQRGFADVEVRYLHPRKPPPDDQTLARQRGTLPPGMLEEINWALFGPMDYAVIATKAPVG